MTEFHTQTRDELTDEYRVFYVTAWGYAADHLFGWFPKALNCHRDIFALLAHEGSRPKYLRERTRGERPDLIPFTEFLNDMGMTYAAIGDCYSYRAGQMHELLSIERYKNIPVVNLVRHPLPWLEFYVRWRASNMRMRAGSMDPLAWEWKVTCHAYFDYLSLRPYEKEEVEVWAAYQGMFQLNNVLGDITAVDRHIPIERVADDPEVFKDVVRHITRGRAEFDQADIDRAYSMSHILFRGEERVETDPRELLTTWPDWKIEAFRRLVRREALDVYKSFGYDLLDLDRQGRETIVVPGKVARPIFVSSVMKSGTWLMRSILEMMTGLKPHEPEIKPDSGSPEYKDENFIEFPRDTFFSWHSTLTPRSVALLKGCQAKNIFLIRNIYDVILAVYSHLSRDVDAAIGRSVRGSNYFSDKTIEQSLSLIISGFTCPHLTWRGLAPLIEQMAGMLDLVESGQALLLTYEELTGNKHAAIHKLMQHLEDHVVENTSIEIMREKARSLNQDPHMTRPEDRLSRDVFLRYHEEMVDLVVWATAPGLPERLSALGYSRIFSIENETKNPGALEVRK
jgi:hypothetical protein